MSLYGVFISMATLGKATSINQMVSEGKKSIKKKFRQFSRGESDGSAATASWRQNKPFVEVYLAIGVKLRQDEYDFVTPKGEREPLTCLNGRVERPFSYQTVISPIPKSQLMMITAPFIIKVKAWRFFLPKKAAKIQRPALRKVRGGMALLDTLCE